MKTSQIVQALRNSATPAARLAAWQNKPLWNRRKMLAEHYNKSATLAERRKAIIDAQGPELSSPEAESPLLWLSGTSDPQIADWTAGRDFLDHRGWYSDEFHDETLETYAITLKAFPRLVFYAVLDSCSDGLRVHLDECEEVDFSGCESEGNAEDARRDCARSVIRSNDRTTEREAEESREYYRKDRAEQDIAENKETLTGLRHEIRALCHELKTLCPSSLAVDFPAAGKALRSALAALLAKRRQLMETNEKLAASL